VVRDQDWNTVPVRVPAVADSQGTETSTELRFEEGDIVYAATVTVRLSADELVIDLDGRAETAFLRNRIGLVVLHPASEAGREVTVRMSTAAARGVAGPTRSAHTSRSPTSPASTGLATRSSPS
jgi:hypothetical protein